MGKEAKHFYEFGPFRLDVAERLLLRGGESIALTPKVFDTLLLLIENRGQALEKQELLRKLWPDTFVDEGNLSQNVSILRKALGDNTDECRYIETIPKRGYRFVAEVAELEVGGASNTRHRMLVAAIVAAVIAGAAGLWLVKPGDDATQASAGVAGKERNETAEAALVPVPLTSYPGLETRPSFSPDGTQVVFQWGEFGALAKICVQLVGASEPLCLTNGIAPVWSPDGRSIAFGKVATKDGVLLISPIGGSERKLTELDIFDRVAWHPSGKWLVVAGRDSLGEPGVLFSLSTETGEKRRLTSPPEGSFDTAPAVSPDGKAVIFGRDFGGWNVDLYLLELTEGLEPKGEPKRITSENTYSSYPTWTPDGQAIVFISGTPDIPGLYEMSLSGPGWNPGKPRRLSFAGEGVRTPTISRQGRLAYASFSPNADVWRLELQGGRRVTVPPKSLITSSRFEHDQEYSPDGKRIAFVSTRSGSHEIWVCDSDGSNAMQLTSLGSSFYTVGPHWSPDGRLILFSSNPEGRADTYVIGSDGGKPKLLFPNFAVDSWSRDGKWIYFERTGDGDVWKRPWPPSEQDGDAVQVTRKGGYDAHESPDGSILYYLKDDQELWKVPVKGGEETQVLGSLSCRFFAVVDQGIYFMTGFRPSGNPPNPSIEYLSFATGKVATIATLSGPVWPGLSVSPDGRWLLYAQDQFRGGDLWMVENFR